MRKLSSIQALRGVAALAVVAYHASQWTQVYGLTSRVFEVGAAGVDLFFLISGFVMWATVAERPVTPAGFLWRRLSRVGPPYWVATLATVAAFLIWPQIFQEVELGGSTAQALTDLSLSLGFIPHPDPRGLPFPVLQPGWTLNYEALFYLAFAFGLWAKGRWQFACLTAALVAVWMVGVSWPRAYTFIANMLLMEFVAGAALAIAWRSGLLKPGPWPIAALVCGFGFVILQQALGYQPGFWRPLLWGGATSLALGGAVASETGSLARLWRWLSPLGNASYSIYLWHWPALMALARLAGVKSGPVFMLEALTLSIGLGLASRRLIEAPLVAAFRRWGPVQPSGSQVGGSA